MPSTGICICVQKNLSSCLHLKEPYIDVCLYNKTNLAEMLLYTDPLHSTEERPNTYRSHQVLMPSICRHMMVRRSRVDVDTPSKRYIDVDGKKFLCWMPDEFLPWLHLLDIWLRPTFSDAPNTGMGKFTCQYLSIVLIHVVFSLRGPFFNWKIPFRRLLK